MKYMKNVAITIFYIMFTVLYSCEPVIETEYVEVEVETIVTETIIEEVETEVIVDREVFIEVPVEVEKIVTEERIVEVEVEKIVNTETVVTEYVEVEIEVPVTETVIEYVDRVEVVTEYVDRIETVVEYVDRVETIVEYVDVVETVVETVEIEKVVEVDNIVYTETIVYVEKEIYVMEEPEVVVDPIKEYDNYITTNNKVLGVTQEGFEEIPLIQGLFKIDGVIYFIEGESLCSQSGGVVTIIEPADFPEVPASVYFEFESGDYRILNSVYGNDDISKVYNGSPNVAYYMIDGACLRGSDLIYSTPIDTGTRLKGVYLWTVNGNPLLIMDSGRIW